MAKIKVADGIKVVNQLTLYRDTILDYLGYHNVITMVLKCRKGEQSQGQSDAK